MSNFEPAERSMTNLMTHLAAGLAGRLRSLVLMLDRLDRLESGSGNWLADFEADELPEAAAELTLRALRAVANPNTFTLLTALAGNDTHSIAQLMAITGFGRLALSERLNDLVQLGLAIRLIDTDHAQITPAGAAMLQLIEVLQSGVIEQYRDLTVRP